MALINQLQLFDKLQQYIDEKIEGVPLQLEQLFDEYGLKIVIANIDDIGIVADNIDSVSTLAPLADEMLLIATPEMTEAILHASENALLSQSESWEAEADAMTADSYATEGIYIFVKVYTSNGDGTFTVTDTSHYSAYHWSTVAGVEAQGLMLQGIWDLSAHTDPLTEPPAPTPVVPTDPLLNGMYWYVVGESIYDPAGTGVIPYPTYGGPYQSDDKIVYIEDNNLPFEPWFRLLDIVNWNRLIEVPDNITNAFDRRGVLAGDKMIGNLEIEVSDPSIILNDIASSVNNVIKSDANGRLTFLTVDDLGVFIANQMAIEANSLVLYLTSTDILWDGNKLWHEGNDGAGSGLDADLLDGKDSTDYYQRIAVVAPDLDSLIENAAYSVSGLTVPLYGASSGALYVTTNVNQVEQLFHKGSVLCTRVSGDLGSTWNAWVQYGGMTFNGTRLSITLPV